MHNELYKRNTSILILVEDRRFSLTKKVTVKQSIKEGRFPMRRKICDVGWRCVTVHGNLLVEKYGRN